MDREEEGTGSVDSWEETAVLVAQEIRDWSERVLEVPSEMFGGLPACPFARKAWLSESVMIHVTMSLDAVVDMKACFPPTEDLLHVFAYLDYESMTPEEFNAWIDEQNEQHFGVWLMGFHPDSAEDPLTAEYEGLCDENYAIIIMQSLDHIVLASESLRKTGYYSNFPEEDMEYINARRDVFDKWDKKVNAKAYQEQEEVYLSQRINEEDIEH